MHTPITEIMGKRRSIRRFKQDRIHPDLIKKMIEVARFAPSAANLQPLEYIMVTDEQQCNKIFPHLCWAGYLTDWQPSEQDQPAAYITILVTKENPYYQRDVGLASAHIVLCAEAEEIGSCILCKINREPLKSLLDIPEHIMLDSIIALGYKKEQPVVEDRSDTVKYYYDADQTLHVPKKPLTKILHENRYREK